MPVINYCKLSPDAMPFKYRHLHDACMDVHCIHDQVIHAGETVMMHTGIALEIPEGYEGIIRGRSGLASKGIFAHVGTIDSNYRGEICVLLYNSTKVHYKVEALDRIAQFCIQPVHNIILLQCDELTKTDRGSDGFGSTGK